jgi:hypothetical protein
VVSEVLVLGLAARTTLAGAKLAIQSALLAHFGACGASREPMSDWQLFRRPHGASQSSTELVPLLSDADWTLLLPSALESSLVVLMQPLDGPSLLGCCGTADHPPLDEPLCHDDVCEGAPKASLILFPKPCSRRWIVSRINAGGLCH